MKSLKHCDKGSSACSFTKSNKACPLAARQRLRTRAAGNAGVLKHAETAASHQAVIAREPAGVQPGRDFAPSAPRHSAGPVRQNAFEVAQSLFEALNRRDVSAVISLLDEDVVYENYGATAVLQGRAAVGRFYLEALMSFPEDAVFVMQPSPLASGAPVDLLQAGVAWHVELQGVVVPLSRGVGLYTLNPATGLLSRAIDSPEHNIKLAMPVLQGIASPLLSTLGPWVLPTAKSVGSLLGMDSSAPPTNSLTATSSGADAGAGSSNSSSATMGFDLVSMGMTQLGDLPGSLLSQLQSALPFAGPQDAPGSGAGGSLTHGSAAAPAPLPPLILPSAKAAGGGGWRSGHGNVTPHLRGQVYGPQATSAAVAAAMAASGGGGGAAAVSPAAAGAAAAPLHASGAAAGDAAHAGGSSDAAAGAAAASLESSSLDGSISGEQDASAPAPGSWSPWGFPWPSWGSGRRAKPAAAPAADLSSTTTDPTALAVGTEEADAEGAAVHSAHAGARAASPAAASAAGSYAAPVAAGSAAAGSAPRAAPGAALARGVGPAPYGAYAQSRAASYAPAGGAARATAVRATSVISASSATGSLESGGEEAGPLGRGSAWDDGGSGSGSDAEGGSVVAGGWRLPFVLSPTAEVNLSGLWEKDADASQVKEYEAMMDVYQLGGLQKVTARLIDGVDLLHEPPPPSAAAVAGGKFEVSFVTVVPFFRVTERSRFGAPTSGMRRDLRSGKQTSTATAVPGGVRVDYSWPDPVGGTMTEDYLISVDGSRLAVTSTLRVGGKEATATQIYKRSSRNKNEFLNSRRNALGSMADVLRQQEAKYGKLDV